jgi:hypothetical protein
MWDLLNSALSGCVGSVVLILSTAIGIPLAFLGFSIVRSIISGRKGVNGIS